MPQQPFADVLGPERFFQQRIGLQINLGGGEVIDRTQVAVEAVVGGCCRAAGRF